MKVALIFLISATMAGVAAAGRDEVEAVTGAGYALVIVEKCTGIPPPPDYIPRLRAGMTRAGIPDEDFRRGLVTGSMRAESMYRGKPPPQECKEAKALKAVFDKTFL